MRAIRSADSTLACSILGAAAAIGRPIAVQGKVIGIQHGLRGAIADRVRGDPPAAPGQRRDPAGEPARVGEQQARLPPTSAKSWPMRAGARAQPAVGVELDPGQADPRAASGPPGVQLVQTCLAGESAGQVDANPDRQRARFLRGRERLQVRPAAHAHLGDLHQAHRGGPAERGEQAPARSGRSSGGSSTSIGVLPAPRPCGETHARPRCPAGKPRPPHPQQVRVMIDEARHGHRGWPWASSEGRPAGPAGQARGYAAA